MKKLRRAIEFLAGIIRQPAIASAVLHDNRYWKSQFRTTYGHEQTLPEISLAAFVPGDATLEHYMFLGGGSMITDLLLLGHLARKPEVRTYFEIGTWRGESLSAVLEYVDQAYTLDLAEDEMKALRYPQEVRAQMGMLIGGRQNVRYLEGDSRKFDFSQVKTTADLVFIDGNHTYDFVKHDTTAVLKHLYHERSIVIWHDYGQDPENVRWEVYKAIMDAVPKDLQACLYHVRHTKCAVLIRDQDWAKQCLDVPADTLESWKVHITKSEGR